MLQGKRVREMSDAWLLDLKRQLASLRGRKSSLPTRRLRRGLRKSALGSSFCDMQIEAPNPAIATSRRMRNRSRPLAMRFLLGTSVLLVFVPSGGVRAQPSEEGEDHALVLRRLVDDVEKGRRVLVKHRGEPFAISADQLGELFASQVLTGEMPVDSIVARVRKLRQDSDFMLSQIKHQLAQMGVDTRAAIGETLTWYAPDGTWSMLCDGRYPPEIRGQIGGLEWEEASDGVQRLRFDVYRDLRGLVAGLNGLVVAGRSSGSKYPAQIPGSDFDDVGTLIWNAVVSQKVAPRPGEDGTMEVSGELRYVGNYGRCQGRWGAG